MALKATVDVQSVPDAAVNEMRNQPGIWNSIYATGCACVVRPRV